MLIIPSGVKIHLALGRTDMRKGFDSLAVLVQEVLKKDPFSGHLFAFRGKKADGTVTLTPAQLAMLIEGIDWRTPERTWKPALAG